MPIANLEEYIAQTQLALSDLNSYLTETQIEFAITQAIDELELTYPIADGALRFWAVQRAKRHAMDLLKTAAAYKFKYKQINLNQRFDHLSRQIWQMDLDFKSAIKQDPTLFGIDAYKLFGTYLGNGFVYDREGNDITRIIEDAGIDNEGYRYLR
jgi:hypothetical protein